MTFLAMLVALISTAASFERLRHVRRLARYDLASLGRALARGSRAGRLREVRDRLVAEGQSWESELATCALEAGSDAERTALMNEQLGDVESRLSWGNRIPAVAARLSAMAALAILFFAVAGGGVILADIIPVVAWGGAGVVVALATGREADRAADEIRRSVDAFVARVLDTARLPNGVASTRPEGS